MPQSSESRALLVYCRRHWLTLFLLLLPVIITYALLLALEGVAISSIDQWLPVSSFESATRASLFVTASLTFCRLGLIGIGVWVVLNRWQPTSRPAAHFALLWALASALVTGAVLAIDLWQHKLQYGGGNYTGEIVRSILLLTIYAKLLLCYPGVRLLCSTVRSVGTRNWSTIWSTVPIVESIALYCCVLMLKLTIESVFVTAMSYLPFVAPFWFIPDELSRTRYFVGQGTRIVAECVGVLFYVAFFVAISRTTSRVCSPTTCNLDQSQ